MTVGDLKELLAQVDDSLLVVLSKDSEGNSYSPAAQVTYTRYTPRAAWVGDLESCAFNDANAICLWPIR